MGDLISRSALLQEVKSLRVTVMGLRAGKGVLHEYAKQYRDTLVRIINEQPVIEAAQVVHAEWIVVGEICGIQIRKCSACGKEHATLPKPYCCYCGAKMDGGSD